MSARPVIRRQRGSNVRRQRGSIARRQRGSIARRQRGLSYVEVLTAVVILALCLAPALDALRDATNVSGVQHAREVNQAQLKARMEEVLANTFATLDAAALAAGNSPLATVAAYSDAPGTANRRLARLYRYDGSAASASDTGLLWVRVEIEGTVLRLDTLKARR